MIRVDERGEYEYMSLDSDRQQKDLRQNSVCFARLMIVDWIETWTSPVVLVIVCSAAATE